MDNFSDLQKDIDSAIYSAYQFGNVTGAPQNTTFNGDVAAQMLRENIKTTPSLVSTSGGVPSVYGDSQMNLTFERYYMHPNFSRLGYSPWRDNDRLYNENSSWLDNTSRSIKAMGHIAMESFGSNKPFISTLDLFDPLNYDEESAGSISRMMKLGYDTSGGLGAFTNNFLLNSGITLGITASALVEEAVIAGASALMAKTGVGIPAAVGTLGVGTAATIGKFARNIGKVFNANDLVFKLARNTDELKQVYDFSKMGRALDNKVVDFFNPLSNTAKLLKEYPETFKGLNALGKTATSFGAFYADARAAARVLNEAQMEGGLVLNQMVEDGIRKEYDATGQYPTEEKIAGIKEAAQNAAFATTMINLPLIFFSNKVGLDNIIKNLPKGKNLISALDDVKQFGSFSKIKGQGYKYLTSPLQKISAGARPVEIAKSFLNYTRYNFSEAIQENLQEATSAGVINYYKKLFENPMIDQHMLLKESVALGIGEQFTGQGLETFFSGFLTGGLMGGMGKIANLGINVGQRIYDPVAFKDYQDEKKKLKEELEESANYLDKNFLDLGRGPIDMINPNAVNAAQQSAASKTMNASNQTGNVKVSKDAQRLSLFEHVSNAIKGGFYNNIIDDYKSQLAVDDKTLAEAFGRDITEVPKLRSDISNAIADAENIKKLHDKYNFGNPVNLKSVSKDDPKYRQLLARYNAFETVRKMLIMSEDTIKDGTYRMNKITESLMTLLPEFGELDSDDILTLVDTFRLEAYKFDQIKQELELAKSTQSSPSTTPEDREKARIKEQYISRKLIALTDLHTKLKSFRSKKETNTEFTDDERSALSGAYNAYISVLNQNPERKSSVVTTTNLDESLNYILDYISLESENELLTSIISVLQDPQGFATTVNDTTNYLEQILNDTSFVSKMVNRGVSLLEHNAIYNFMFTKFGVYVKEYEDGSVAFERPSANVVDALIPVDPLSEEYEEMLNAFFDKKEALSKIDATTEKIKKTKKVQADRVAKDKRDFETIKAALKKEDPSLSDEALDRKSRFILMIPQLRDLYIQDSVLDGLAQNIEDAASTPTTKEEVEEALKLLEVAKFKIVKDPDTGVTYYVQVDEEGNPLEESLEWKRVTSLFKTKEFGTEKFAHRGNIIDGLLRALIGDKSLTKEQFKEAYVELQKENPEAFEFTDDNLTTLRSTLDNFIASIESQGYTLRANIPTLWGTIDEQYVAGTMDIIAVNDKGETLLIDLKTSSSNRRKAYAMETALKKVSGDKYDLVKQKIVANNNKIKGDVSKGEKNLLNDSEIGDILNNFLSIEDDSKIKPYVDVNAIFFYKDSDENQLNAYADLLEQRTGIKVSGLFVLPLTIQDNNNNKTYTKIEAATEKINNKDRYALKVSRKQPIAPKIETTETPKTEEKEVVEEETLEEEPLTEEEIKLRDERVELINKTIGLLEKRKEKGVQSITNVENTLEYLKELLDETSELSFEEVKKILNTIKTLEEAISSNSARKSKRGQAISLSIEEYKKQFRTEKQLFNDIANRIKYLKEDLQQLKQIDKDLSDQINYYRNMIANKDFKTLSFEEIEEKIEIINKKKSVLEKIIASLLRVIKQSVFYLKEYVKITTKSINDLEIFKKNTNFKRLNTEELKKLIDAEDSSATTEYDKLRKQADELEKAIENNLDSIEIVEGAKQKEQERLDDLYNVVQKYNNQLRYLNNLLTVLYPDLAKIKLEKATAGKTAKEQVAPGVKKAPAPTAKPSPQKTEARLEDAKKEKAKAEKRTAKPKKEKPTTTPTAQPTVSDKKADIPLGKINNTEYEVKTDGVYYQDKKLDNPENKTHRQLIEADIKRRRQEELDRETPVKNENITVDFGGGVSVKYQVITYKDGSVKISTVDEKAKRYNELSDEVFKDYAKIDFESDAKGIIKTELIKDDYTDKQSQEIKAAKEKTINSKYDAELDALEGTPVTDEKADIEKRRQENDTLGKSILQKLGYKNENRLPNGNVKGGQSGWKIRFNIKSPTGENYFNKGNKVLENDKHYNEQAQKLVDWLNNYFQTTSKGSVQEAIKGYNLHGFNKENPSSIWKFLSGGEQGEADFTIYIGSADDVLKFVEDVKASPIANLLVAGNQGSDVNITSDGIFKARIEGASIGFSGYGTPTNLNNVTGKDDFTFVFDGKRVNINYGKTKNLSDISIIVEGGNAQGVNFSYKVVGDENLKKDFPELYKNIRNIIGFQLYGNYLQGSNNEFLKLTGVDKINAKYDAELDALEETGIEETDTTTNTSNIGPVSSIKLDTVYPIYKDNKQVGSVVLQSVNGIPAFVFTNSKGQVSTPSAITTLSNNFFNANEGLFEHWYNNILTDDNRQSVSLYKMATTASQKDLFVAIYGISKTVFNKNIDLLEDAVSTNEDILDTFKGKLIYGTPGVGKTQFITEYNARPESQRKHTLIDVDDLLVARLQELNAKLGFAGDLEFTNENLFAIINKFGKTFGTTERTKELDNLLYNPVLEMIKSEKAKGSILLTGTKRFIKEADIAVLSEERSNILRDRIVTGEGDVKKYLEAENRFTKQVIILKQGQPFSDVLVKGIDAVEADAAFRQLKRNLFNRMIFDDFTLVKLITELSKVNLSELNSNQLVDLFNTIITKESPFYSEIISLDGNIDEKSKELFNYFKTFYNSNETSVTDRSVLLRKIIDVLSNIAPNSISITDLNNPLSNFAVLSSVNGDNIEYNVFSSIGAEPQLKSQSISTFVTAVSKNRSKIISFRETVQGETEKIDSPEAVGKNINNLPKLDEKDIFNKPCGPINT